MTDPTRTTVATLVTMKTSSSGLALLYGRSPGRVSAVRYFMEQPAVWVWPDRCGCSRQADAHGLPTTRNLNSLQDFPIADRKSQLQWETEGGPLGLLHLLHGHDGFVGRGVPGMT